MREVTVVSGKGGTGKTSLVACFGQLAGSVVMADCDVDAANLPLLLAPEVKETNRFLSGHLAIIWQNRCVACGGCLDYCEYDAVRMDGEGAGSATFAIDPFACEGCGVCVEFCPVKAIGFPERECGDWYVSETRVGPMVHARLGIGAENSGKLVTTVRQAARRLAEGDDYGLLLVDGPPGIGCAAIASITGADRVLIVTEPTVSGIHDLERVLSLAARLEAPVAICVNRWDLNPDQTARIEVLAAERGIPLLGRIPYDHAFVDAMRQGRTVLEFAGDASPAAGAIRQLWEQL